MTKRSVRISRRYFLASSAALAGAVTFATPLRAQTTHTLRFLNFGDRSTFWAKSFEFFSSTVEKNSNGALKIEWAGGPEVVPPLQQPEAVSQGIFDMTHTATSYYAAAVPEALCMTGGKATPAAIRSSGLLEMLDQIHQKKFNVSVLGFATSGVPYGVFAKQPIDSLVSLGGRKIRSIPLFDPILQELGVAPVTIAPFEIYTSLERGVVDGFCHALVTISDLNLHKLSPYLMQPTFYNSRTPVIINSDALAKLPAELQSVLRQSFEEAEKQAFDFSVETSKGEMAKLASEGLVENQLPAEEAARFLKIGDDALWTRINRDSPTDGPVLRELFTKADAA